ncbi:gp61 [Listeria phage P40]|uniref:gp61 n=1 Tax=Listeria phage P40 TaxID=560178 RepID=UPI000181990A|nr:gp61 [Listeria phage P40]ACI00421.1 gp61 [Listeria phage P40]
MCDFCEVKMDIPERFNPAIEISLDTENDICVHLTTTDEVFFFKINNCPMCGERLNHK